VKWVDNWTFTTPERTEGSNLAKNKVFGQILRKRLKNSIFKPPFVLSSFFEIHVFRSPDMSPKKDISPKKSECFSLLKENLDDIRNNINPDIFIISLK
jgi:hypothetical protein